MDIAKSTRVGLAKVHCNKAWLARKVGVTPQYIGQVYNGHTKPCTDTISKLASAFNVVDSVFIQWGEE